MQLILKDNYYLTTESVNKIIIPYLRVVIKDSLANPRYNAFFRFIEADYAITKTQVIAAIDASIKYTYSAKLGWIIYFDNNKKIKSKNKQAISIASILSLFAQGNLSMKGNNLIYTIFSNLKKNAETLVLFSDFIL